MMAGCAARDRQPADSVASAWRQQEQGKTPLANTYRERAATDVRRSGRTAAPSESPIATVNGRPISRRHFDELLLRSHGVAVLEQLVGLEATATAAEERGLTVSPLDVDQEYERALRRLANPLSSVTSEALDRVTAERLLDTVLSSRNVSREEFDIVTRRNAYLRKIVESEQVFTEDELRREYERLYGQRVQVRHIQLATLADVEQVKDRLARGEDFGELATRYSAHRSSAKAGGRLDPFSAEDEDVPALLRQVAFSLQPGEVSSAVRVGEWYHLIMLESQLEAEDVEFGRVRELVEHRLRERVTEPAMFDLFEKLFRQATIEVHDPLLGQAFDARHSGRTR
jgi:foldase protein PrsA